MPRAFICLDDGSCHGDSLGPEAELVTALGQHWPRPQTVLLVEDARFLDAAPTDIRFLAVAPILGPAGLPAGVLCLSDSAPRSIDDEDRGRLEDLTRIAQSHLRASAECRELADQAGLFRTLAENSADTLVRGGVDGLRSYLSPSVQSLLGYAPAELIGTPAIDFVHPEDIDLFRVGMRELKDGRIDSFTTEHRHRHKDGSWVWLEAFVQVTRNAVTGRKDGYVTSVRGTSRRKEVEARLEHSATHDSLTGLPNRALLYGRLQSLLADPTGTATGCTVFCLDLDGFKQVNDRFGHGPGDVVLQQVANRLQRCMQSGDTLARRGGDEFVVIQPAGATPAGSAIALADHMIRAVSMPIEFEGVPASIGLSIGIAFAPQAGTDAETVLRAADAALYEAKQAGRNRYSISMRPDRHHTWGTSR